MPLVPILLAIIALLNTFGIGFIAYKVEQTVGDVTHPGKDAPPGTPPTPPAALPIGLIIGALIAYALYKEI